MTMLELYNELVMPVCALEEVCDKTEESATVNVISIALRKILNDVEAEAHKKGEY